MDFQSSDSATKKNNDSHHLDQTSAEPSLEPITPVATKENGDFPVDLSSPLSVGKRVPKALNFDVDGSRERDCATPRTPKDGVFDPFAPGSDDKTFAPFCRKYYNEARARVVRRLDFGSSFKAKEYLGCVDDLELCNDEKMFESVYESLLEAIISKQVENALAEISMSEWKSDDCQTPRSAPRLNGAAETCPDAPRKAKDKAWNVSKNKDLELLSRKLEF